jgi:acetamidase/formamidase
VLPTIVSADAVQFGWDNSRLPVAAVPDGATLELALRDASNGQIRPGDHAPVVEAADRRQMNPLIGPLVIEDAQAGMTLQVDVLEVEPERAGWTAVFPGFGLLAEDFPDSALLHWEIAGGVVEGAGLRFPSSPFLGVIGVAPGAPGEHSVVPPRRVGGNLDTRQLGPGASLFLPIEADGALVGVGDAHARQGDGEVCGTALEVAARTTVRLSVRRHVVLETPEFVPSPEGMRAAERSYATTGIEPDLHEAARSAVRRMIEHLTRRYGFEPDVAYMLCSVLVDLRVSEVVDRPNWVISAFWPESIVERRGSFPAR